MYSRQAGFFLASSRFTHILLAVVLQLPHFSMSLTMSFATNTPPAYLQAVIFFLLNFHQVYVLLLKTAAQRNRGSCFGILEGGYNHEVLGQNVLAFVEGLGGK
jgi:hypothetical protein